MVFKVGDRVKAIGSVDGIVMGGKTGTVVRIGRGTRCDISVEFDDKFYAGHECGGTAKEGHGRNGSSAEFNLINTTSENMNLVEKFKLASKTEPEKTFIKAGIMSMDGTLTTEGRDLWTAFLVKKFGDDFKTEVVDPILAEIEAEK